MRTFFETVAGVTASNTRGRHVFAFTEVPDMADKIIVTDDEPKPAKPHVVIVVPEDTEKKEKVVTEKTTIIKTKVE